LHTHKKIATLIKSLNILYNLDLTPDLTPDLNVAMGLDSNGSKIYSKQ
jgi:hypothetical protein